VAEISAGVGRVAAPAEALVAVWGGFSGVAARAVAARAAAEKEAARVAVKAAWAAKVARRAVVVA
jgi:hypothetical protein